ncbi:2-hydroxyisoflavanone dehydratase-like [Prosopis cineraria]|uniref:2-hydroxyisoflavanone dehydratase-like n=1 Tax=Prosopis cineraria TaxID=364024 RepID=UPI00240FF9BA|nr:2-hydroxyisoflavanone dehydratase-like [Prosopis cineraria]
MASAASATSSATKEIEIEFPNLIRLYKDGTVERLFGSPIVPPSLHDNDTGVSSKDVVISDDPSISARLYLPRSVQSKVQKLPILVYFHGGGFCLESAFSFLDQRYLNLIAAEANVIAVSVEYRLAPEHRLPAAFEDCWDSLKWVSSHSTPTNAGEPWLLNHGDFNRVYLGGDSAGGNIVHNIAMRCGAEDLPGGVKLAGGFLSCPFFWGSKPIGSEPKEGHEQSLPLLLWNFLYPSAPGGIDNPAINPTVDGAPSLASMGCSKLLVYVCGKDQLRDRVVLYYEAVKESGWKGEVELYEVEGEDHCFHIFNPETDNAKKVFNRLASFLI